jgi:hypothetical protein
MCYTVAGDAAALAPFEIEVSHCMDYDRLLPQLFTLGCLSFQLALIGVMPRLQSLELVRHITRSLHRLTVVHCDDIDFEALPITTEADELCAKLLNAWKGLHGPAHHKTTTAKIVRLDGRFPRRAHVSKKAAVLSTSVPSEDSVSTGTDDDDSDTAASADSDNTREAREEWRALCRASERSLRDGEHNGNIYTAGECIGRALMTLTTAAICTEALAFYGVLHSRRLQEVCCLGRWFDSQVSAPVGQSSCAV